MAHACFFLNVVFHWTLLHNVFFWKLILFYISAIHDYKEALEIESGYQRAEEGIKRAQKLQKQSEKRDYYKILGVSRNANKQEITKAYR